jgi:hemolysin activation/secretion protein
MTKKTLISAAVAALLCANSAAQTPPTATPTAGASGAAAPSDTEPQRVPALDSKARQRRLETAEGFLLNAMQEQSKNDKLSLEQLPKLERVLFVRSPGNAQEIQALAARIKAKAELGAIPTVDVDGLPDLKTAALTADLNTLLGRPYTLALAVEVQESMRRALDAAGKPFALVSLAPVDAANRRLIVLVEPARLESKEVVQAKLFSPELYASHVRIAPGEEIDLLKLERDVAFLSKTGYRSAQLVWAAGEKQGATKLIIRVNPEKLWDVSASASNSGNKTTGIARLGLNVAYGNLWGQGHVLDYGLSTDATAKRMISHSLGYVAPLPWNHTLSLNTQSTDTNPEIPAPLATPGKSSSWKLKYALDLPPNSWLTQQELALGFEHKRSDNTTLFSNVPVTNSLHTLGQWLLQYQGRMADPFGGTQIALDFTHSPGNRGALNSDANLQTIRENARSRYNILQMRLQRQIQLPAKWNWSSALKLQRADANLISSEQLAIAGSSAVRGHGAGQSSSDAGWVWRNDWSRPVYTSDSLNLRGSVFFDTGAGKEHLATGVESKIRRSAVGFGLNTSFGKWSVNIESGKPLQIAGQPKAPKSHTSLTISTQLY